MISFYPGPSKVENKLSEYFAEAHSQGILSMNHRSPGCMQLVEETSSLIKKKLNVPEEYSIFYVSAATECWEILAQSYDGISYHFYNGSFGEKWFNATRKIKPQAIGYQFDLSKELKLGELDLSMEEGLICITQNETSNGTRVSNKRIAKVRKKYPDHLIAIDATSSLGGAFLQIENADIWYASVQKCFGLPAGMALMICSPKAIEAAMNYAENKHYNSLTSIIQNMEKNQTTHTPNVANIYLLNRVMNERKNISKVANKLEKRAAEFYEFIGTKDMVNPLVDKKNIRSNTVFSVKGKPESIERLKSKALEKGLTLGNGYGEWKGHTFRVANFPQITNKEMKKLLSFLDENLT
ncbi:aminotransferase class V-fold PLP-dependent enzyme [Fulvivirga lutea]|uniref:phosphoserine transaminase n=1 Tax=Fulvivirga lutea TaxID=2810512 RepID=A0A974WG45_9BACT|nr:aminotransferase class V-fold PLP-dependent enzyme [Fulvivirga lutea]QSE97651.1 aminotransferase class V-fold PLP-dependent enzyme [Fulvivirga lutea]